MRRAGCRKHWSFQAILCYQGIEDDVSSCAFHHTSRPEFILGARVRCGCLLHAFCGALGILPEELQIRLRELVRKRVRIAVAQIDVGLSAVLEVDDEEHALCEWAKACRNRTRLAAATLERKKRLKTNALIMRNG